MQNTAAADQPLITVVTATYKKFGQVYETIKSVLSQDYPNIQYVICDDGSDNFPKAEITAYIEEHRKENLKDVKIFDSPVNRGTVRNLNNGYQNSEGEYIFNLSCGDVFYANDVLSKLVARFTEKKCDVLVASRMQYQGNYEPICLMPHYEEREVIAKMDTPRKQYTALVTSQYYDMASGSAMYFSRKIMEQFGFFDESYVLWEDGPFLAKFLWEHTLELAYDIVSIWYETGGVSSVKVQQMHPLMQKDIYYYNEHETTAHIDALPKKSQHLIRFHNARTTCQSKTALLKLIVRYPDAFVSHYFYRRNRLKMRAHDGSYIQQIRKES